MAGYDERLAVEFDSHAVAMFKMNFPQVPVYAGDIKQLTAEQALEISGLKPGELDVLDGSPPCQGFSTVGKREVSDTRNQLWREYVRMLMVFKPKVFVLENVAAMPTGRTRPIFDEMIEVLKDCGYQISAKIMNAVWFGVPQFRKRLIVIGSRISEPSHPKPSTKMIILREALRDVPDGLSTSNGNGKTGRVARAMSPWMEGNDILPGTYFSYKKCAWDRPSRTLTKTAADINHPDRSQPFTIPELKRICSFPDGFKLEGSWTQQAARLGNSVPPLLMKAIAEHIKKEVLTEGGASPTPTLQKAAVA